MTAKAPASDEWTGPGSGTTTKPAPLGSLFGVSKATSKVQVLLQRAVAPSGLTGATVSRLGEKDLKPTYSPGSAAVSGSIGDILQEFALMDGQDLYQLQQQLYAAGLYSSDYYNKKTPKQIAAGLMGDEDTQAAFKKAVKRAAKTQKTVGEILGEAAATPAIQRRLASVGVGTATQPQTIQISAPADLQLTLEQAFKQEGVGRLPNKGEIASYVKDIQSKQKQVQSQKGGVVTAVDPSSAAIMRARAVPKVPQKKTTDQQAFEAMGAADKADAIRVAAENYMRDAKAKGIALTPERAKAIGEDAVKNGYANDKTRTDAALAAEARPKGPATAAADPSAPHVAGDKGVSLDRLRTLASQYEVPMSEQTLQAWSSSIAAGNADETAFIDLLKNRAKGLYTDPNFTKALDSGLTTKDYLDSWREQVARTLEVSPDAVDFQSPQYASLLETVNDKGERRMRTLGEIAQAARETPQYQTTTQAKQAAASIADTIGRAFGKVA